MITDKNIRINKYLSESGLCSRREADRLIEAGKVIINGNKAVIGDKVSYGDTVELDGKAISNTNKRIYIAYNKPVGITTTTDKRDTTNIIDAVNFKDRVFPIGRLDKDSSGLIILTNDGDIVNKILRSVNQHEKEYEVRVNKPIETSFINGIKSGVPILDTVTRKCEVYPIDDYNFRIILTQGLNRQIRRMCEYFDYRVVDLKRTRIMNIKLGELPTGKYRYLNEVEFNILNNALSGSVK